MSSPYRIQPPCLPSYRDSYNNYSPTNSPRFTPNQRLSNGFSARSNSSHVKPNINSNNKPNIVTKIGQRNPSPVPRKKGPDWIDKLTSEITLNPIARARQRAASVSPSAHLLFPSPTSPTTRTPRTLRRIIDDSGFKVLKESPLSARDSYYARDLKLEDKNIIRHKIDIKPSPRPYSTRVLPYGSSYSNHGNDINNLNNNNNNHNINNKDESHENRNNDNNSYYYNYRNMNSDLIAHRNHSNKASNTSDYADNVTNTNNQFPRNNHHNSISSNINEYDLNWNENKIMTPFITSKIKKAYPKSERKQRKDNNFIFNDYNNDNDNQMSVNSKNNCNHKYDLCDNFNQHDFNEAHSIISNERTKTKTEATVNNNIENNNINPSYRKEDIDKLFDLSEFNLDNLARIESIDSLKLSDDNTLILSPPQSPPRTPEQNSGRKSVRFVLPNKE
ncbi:hypothetical protein TRFO_32379 [Tritrichomonas foetus]|uniref:Uncharacterized protein n=1 Tax=Tritrichomonas foetus TaxID=1144522 RepID=A0A1J4JTN6_9EUKA|nr:hypothetical protein TRFO_32379 [Tritrichomonas foetus]|eukprot:OHT00860.1 hypothetical protein TRFO_32379 [Tritrichomonas foetus]